MGKIVGKRTSFALILLTTWWGLCSGAVIDMSVLDTDGSPVVQAGVGHPFVLEVTLSDVAQLGQAPQIEGVEQFDIKHAGMRMMSVNGKVSSHHRYELRIDEPGTYSLGPATFEYKGKQLVSNTVRVVVGNEQIEEKKGSDETRAPILLRLSADKDHAVVGERVTCQLRFYLSDPDVALRKFIEQENSLFRRSQSRGPRKGRETLDGVEYSYIEWEWDIYSQKSGSHILPAYGADYDREIERDDLWGGLGKLLGNYVETKRVYSNALPLQVDELPSSVRAVQGIGSFSELRVSAKPSVAKQGEGILVALEVIGDGDPDGIIISELRGIPKELKYYESKQVALDSSMHNSKSGKRFEYIVQGLRVGSWEIPSQLFYYYDVVPRSYKDLRSTPITITVMPGSNQGVQSYGNGPGIVEQDEIAGICKTHLYTTTSRSSALPWWLFIFLLLLPVFVLVYCRITSVFSKRSRINYRAKRARNAFRYVRTRLDQCRKKKDVRRLHSVFTEFFADRWHVSVGTISVSFINKRLRDVGMNEEQRVEWDRFFSEISEHAFGVHKEGEHKDDLFNQAEQWINRLEKVL